MNENTQIDTKVVVVTSGKGGVGKSSTIVNLSKELAVQGKKVLLIDFDIGLRNLDILLGLEERIVYNIVDLMNEKVKVNQVVVKDKKTPNLHLIAASQIDDKNVLDDKKVEKLIKNLKSLDYDYIMLDSPAGIEGGFEHAMRFADKAIIVVNPEFSSLRDADRVIGILDSKNYLIEQGYELEKKLIINRIKPEMIAEETMLTEESIKETLCIDVIGLVLDKPEEIIKSSNLGIPTVMDETSETGAEFKRIVQRFLGNDIPFVDYLEDYKVESTQSQKEKEIQELIEKENTKQKSNGFFGMIKNMIKG